MTTENQLPWAPIYTIKRSGLPEITIQGIVYVWAEDRKLYANAGRSLLRVGDTRASLWSRSLLKPFQLMAIYPVLKKAYPQLSPQHFALMAASHSGDPEQIRCLREILVMGGLQESDLQLCPCRAMNGLPDSVKQILNHPCAGKHIAHLLYQKLSGQPLDTYLASGMPQYTLLQDLLKYLLNRDELAETIDGCGMPNYELNAVEVAQLYHALVMPVGRDLMRQAPDELTDVLANWDEISALIRGNALLVGGQGRLDSRLMRETFSSDIKVIAKEGADGMLALGIGPTTSLADGLGLLIKIASGYEPRQLELIVRTLLIQLGLLETPTKQDTGVLETDFHFDLTQALAQA